jgi:hypothetical protein
VLWDQREQAVGGDESTGGRMPRERQRSVSAAQDGKGSNWRKEEVRPGRLAEGLAKDSGSGDGVEQNAGTKVNGAIRGGGEAMHEQPPATRWIGQ